jgi:hypothetical protein
MRPEGRQGKKSKMLVMRAVIRICSRVGQGRGYGAVQRQAEASNYIASSLSGKKERLRFVNRRGII